MSWAFGFPTQQCILFSSFYQGFFEYLAEEVVVRSLLEGEGFYVLEIAN